MNLLAVQKAALAARGNAVGFAYFMEQGLGKTLTSYADFLELLAERRATRMLVVCPNSFKQGWVEDAEKHGVDMDFFVWEAGNHSYLKSWIKRGFNKPPCLIVNWEAIRPIVKKVKKKKVYYNTPLMDLMFEYVNQKPTLLIWDESIKAKTHDSLSTVGGILLADETMLNGNGFSRLLSGKPITSGPHDLWGQMRLIGQLRGRNYYAFKTAFCKMGGWGMKQVMGVQNEDVLAEMIEPHIFRATKADWTDLPPKTYTIRDYKMTPEMASMYKSMHDEFVLWLNDEENVSVDAAITKYIKLAQIQAGWVYDKDSKIRWLVPDDRNPRLNALQEFIEEELTGKLAIPYHHKPVREQLLRNLGGEDRIAWISGGMSGKEIEEQKSRFNEDRNVRFILLQDEASKYGHTLLGLQERGFQCYTMALYENNYNLDTRSQIEDRIHRHGQEADSVGYVDFSGTPLDRDCIKALQRKENVFQAVFAPLRRKPT
jgi:hypothetical protein